MIAFTKSMQTVMTDPKTSKLVNKAKQVFALKGLDSVADDTRQKIAKSQEILEQLSTGLGEAVTRVHTYLNSMMTFSYLTQRVFIHLIYQGFCG